MINNKNISGTFNAVSPEHINNIELTKKNQKSAYSANISSKYS
jgi:NAD dependent epimerase/dehydratase family enzyme